jgi:hypothetical protein
MENLSPIYISWEELDFFFAFGPHSRMAKALQIPALVLLQQDRLRSDSTGGRIFLDPGPLLQEAGLTHDHLHDVNQALPFMRDFIAGKKISLHAQFEGSVWTGEDVKTERVAEEGFVVRTRFVGDCATGRAELATYAEGLDFCPPRFLLTHFLKVARKLIHNTSSRMVLQYAHVLQRPYYSAENLDDGVWIRFRPGSGNIFHYVFQASVFFKCKKLVSHFLL